MENYEELQSLLEEYGKWDGKFETQPKQGSDLNDELFILGYLKNGAVYLKNGNNVPSLEISNKGKRFLKNGGFVWQNKLRIIKISASIVGFILMSLTFFMTCNDYTSKDKKEIKRQSDSLCKVCSSPNCICHHPEQNAK